MKRLILTTVLLAGSAGALAVSFTGSNLAGGGGTHPSHMPVHSVGAAAPIQGYGPGGNPDLAMINR
jgi:hypothetical protein